LDLATAQRKQATNARFKAVGKPVPYPEAEQQQVQAAPLPVSVLPSDLDPEVDKASQGDSTIKGLNDELERLKKRVEVTGKTSPETAKKIADIQSKATARVSLIAADIKKKRDAEKVKADKEDADHDARMTAFNTEQDEKARVGLLKEAAVPQLSIAGKAFNEKKYDRAIEVAQKMLDADAAGELPAGMVSRLSKIVSDSQDAKAAIEKEVKAAPAKAGEAADKEAVRIKDLISIRQHRIDKRKAELTVKLNTPKTQKAIAADKDIPKWKKEINDLYEKLDKVRPPAPAPAPGGAAPTGQAPATQPAQTPATQPAQPAPAKPADFAARRAETRDPVALAKIDDEQIADIGKRLKGGAALGDPKLLAEMKAMPPAAAWRLRQHLFDIGVLVKGPAK
jgi:hypothetical protein